MPDSDARGARCLAHAMTVARCNQRIREINKRLSHEGDLFCPREDGGTEESHLKEFYSEHFPRDREEVPWEYISVYDELRAAVDACPACKQIDGLVQERKRLKRRRGVALNAIAHLGRNALVDTGEIDA